MSSVKADIPLKPADKCLETEKNVVEFGDYFRYAFVCILPYYCLTNKVIGFTLGHTNTVLSVSKTNDVKLSHIACYSI